MAKIQKAAAARAALEAALADEPVRLDALDAALEAARGARGLLDDALLATADAAHQVAHCHFFYVVLDHQSYWHGASDMHPSPMKQRPGGHAPASNFSIH